MLEHNAMRYLLSRQLWALRTAVPKSSYEEVTASLSVSRDADMYAIGWAREGETYAKTVPRSAYNFYRRGDRADSEGVVETFERENVARARELAAEILGVDKALFDRAARRPLFRTSDYISLAWMILLCGALAVAEPSSAILCGLLFLLYAIEFIPVWGRILTTLGLLAFAPLGWPLTGVGVGAFFAVAHFLDPNRALRGLRVGLGLAALGVGIVMWRFALPSLNDAVIALVLFAAMTPVFIFRWTLGSHFRVFPIALPLLTAAMYLDGAHVVAIAFAISSVISLAAGMFGWRMLPHPPGATHQGVSSSTWQ